MLWEALVPGILIGWLRGGRLGNLARINLTGWPFILTAVLLQTAILLDFKTSAFLLKSFYPYLYSLSLLILLMFFIIHKNERALVVAGLGIALNMLVITANGGKMPVDSSRLSLEAAEALASGENSPLHQPLDSETRLALLGDRITVPYSTNRLLSFGDIIIGVGLAIFIQGQMRTDQHEEEPELEDKKTTI